MTEETLFQEALARLPGERAAFLDEACSGQPELRAAVEALLATHEAAGTVPDKPPGEQVQTVDFEPGQDGPGVTVDHTPEPDEAEFSLASTTDSRPTIEPGLVISGRYTLVEKIGEGGMGEVWVARQTEPVKRQVALKLIKAGMDSKAVLQRFEQERQALAMMDHPSIARVLDGGMTPTGQPFFVMELVTGLPLTRFCDDARLTPRERLELFVPICQAVQHAHQKGIVHRDLKPANILVTQIDGRPLPKVIDFGLAKAMGGKLTNESMSTQFGAVIGTLEYMAPEQAGPSSLDVDTRADVYSLGVILYELLTGLRPLDAKRLRKAALTEVIRIIQEQDPPKPSTRLLTDESLPSRAALRQTEPRKLAAMLRGELDWVVMKCLEKQRDRRYETANSLGRDVQRYLADEPVEARPPSAGYRLGKFLKRNKGPVLAASLVLLALVGGIVGTTWGLVRALKAERSAQTRFDEAEAARAQAAAAAVAEAEQRKKAEQAEADTLAEYRASTDDAIEQLIGSQEELGPHEKLYLERTLKRWQVLADRQGDDERSRAIRAEGHSRMAFVWLRLGRHAESLAASQAALAIQEPLVVQFPAVAKYQEDLGTIHNNLGQALTGLSQHAEARTAHRAARDVFKKLVDEFPTDRRYQNYQHFLAGTHINLGQNLTSLGETEEARTEYQAALKIRKSMAEQNPDVPELQYRLARFHSSLGEFYSGLGRHREAEAEYREGRAICQTLTLQYPTMRDYREVLARCQGNLAMTLTSLGKPSEALAMYQEARSLLKQLVELFPAVAKYQRNLAKVQMGLGNLLLQTSRSEEARVELAAARDMLKRLAVQYPEVPEIQHEWGLSRQGLGHVLMQSRKPEEARVEFESARDTQSQLAKKFPEMPAYRLETARAHSSLGTVFVLMGRDNEATANYQAARDIQKKLVEQYPAVPAYRIELGGSYCNQGLMVHSAGKAAESLEWFDLAIETLKPVYDKEPRDVTTRQYLLNSHGARAQACSELKRHAEAVKDWDRVIELSTPRDRLQFRALRVNSQLRAGMVAEAVAEVAELARIPGAPPPFLYDFACVYSVASEKIADKKKEYGDRAMELLQKAVKAGWKDTAHMTRDTDLDPLREREDFKKLLADLAKKP